MIKVTIDKVGDVSKATIESDTKDLGDKPIADDIVKLAQEVKAMGKFLKTVGYKTNDVVRSKTVPFRYMKRCDEEDKANEEMGDD